MNKDSRIWGEEDLGGRSVRSGERREKMDRSRER